MGIRNNNSSSTIEVMVNAIKRAGRPLTSKEIFNSLTAVNKVKYKLPSVLSKRAQQHINKTSEDTLQLTLESNTDSNITVHTKITLYNGNNLQRTSELKKPKSKSGYDSKSTTTTKLNKIKSNDVNNKHIVSESSYARYIIHQMHIVKNYLNGVDELNDIQQHKLEMVERDIEVYNTLCGSVEISIPNCWATDYGTQYQHDVQQYKELNNIFSDM